MAAPRPSAHFFFCKAHAYVHLRRTYMPHIAANKWASSRIQKTMKKSKLFEENAKNNFLFFIKLIEKYETIDNIKISQLNKYLVD